MEIASFVVDTIAAIGTILALALAYRAFRVAQAAQTEAAATNKRIFELEVLREIQSIIDDPIKFDKLLRYPSRYAEAYGLTNRVEMLAFVSDKDNDLNDLLTFVHCESAMDAARMVADMDRGEEVRLGELMKSTLDISIMEAIHFRLHRGGMFPAIAYRGKNKRSSHSAGE